MERKLIINCPSFVHVANESFHVPILELIVRLVILKPAIESSIHFMTIPLNVPDELNVTPKMSISKPVALPSTVYQAFTFTRFVESAVIVADMLFYILFLYSCQQ
ncbi:MAG: hypothetical protein ACUZ8H_06800 [Candidatus Anammoxibacter sp.]